jgi:hypothetical protein
MFGLGWNVNPDRRPVPRDGNRRLRFQIVRQVLPKLTNSDFGGRLDCVHTDSTSAAAFSGKGSRSRLTAGGLRCLDQTMRRRADWSPLIWRCAGLLDEPVQRGQVLTVNAKHYARRALRRQVRPNFPEAVSHRAAQRHPYSPVMAAWQPPAASRCPAPGVYCCP